MLSPLRANHLAACLPSLSLNCTRNFAISNEVGKKRGRPLVPALKSVNVALNEASEPVAPQHGDSLATSLNHYFSLPPLPPTEEWLSYFSCASPASRDRVSIRAPASAINIARSFINSKKTSTNKPKVVVEAFPGVCRLKLS